jgi:hypothetical protein
MPKPYLLDLGLFLSLNALGGAVGFCVAILFNLTVTETLWVVIASAVLISSFGMRVEENA